MAYDNNSGLPVEPFLAAGFQPVLMGNPTNVRLPKEFHPPVYSVCVQGRTTTAKPARASSGRGNRSLPGIPGAIESSMAGLPAAQGAGGGDRARGAAAGDAKSDDGAHKAHPLQFEWVLWHDQPAQDKNTPWGGMLKQIATFSTVEEYWA